MFDPEEIPKVKKAIQECAIHDRKLLDDLRSEVLLMKPNVRVIKTRTLTTFSLVASDSTNNKLVFDPFYFQLIRVVDSNGENLCLDTITPTTDTDALSTRQFDSLGNAQTALGCLMKDLGCKSLSDLSPMIPSGKMMREHPEKISKSWVLTYRDLCEWAVIYEKICYNGFSTPTVIVRDGLLRSKIFKFNKANGEALFVKMMNKISQAIEGYKKKKVKIFLVGLARRSQVLSRYSLAMQLEDIFPKGEPRYAQVPFDLEAKSLIWKEWMGKSDDSGGEGGDDKPVEGGEINKYSVGQLHLVRFGKRTSDPIWAVDILKSQISNDAEIFGYLLMDAMAGFPTPHYPLCLQKALEHAQVVDFDLDILQDEVFEAIKNILPGDKQAIMDHQILNKE